MTLPLLAVLPPHLGLSPSHSQHRASTVCCIARDLGIAQARATVPEVAKGRHRSLRVYPAMPGWLMCLKSILFSLAFQNWMALMERICRGCEVSQWVSAPVVKPQFGL